MKERLLYMIAMGAVYSAIALLWIIHQFKSKA